MKFTHGLWGIFLMTCISFANAGDYVTEPERLALMQLAEEMNKLEQLIDRAEHNRAGHTRFPMNYKALRDDWRSVRTAILRHLDKPSRAPRQLPPLHADYTH